MFNEIINRDAWSTIRGFVYQVDITILRWMALSNNQILELEKGEDIDIVNSSVKKKEYSRELEQIKYRESNITLNQEEVLEILLNFFQHKINNPSHEVLFRFVTNTSYTVERPALFNNGQGGIEVWIELFSMSTISLSDERFITIQKHFQNRIGDNVTKLEKLVKEKEAKLEGKDKEIKLEGIAKDKALMQLWKDFKSHVENAESFALFIKSFEWSIKNDSHEQISETIKNKIIEAGYVPDLDRAGLLYARLFLHVFKLLTNSGIKILDKDEFIRQQCLPDLNTADQQLLNLIDGILQNLENRIYILEEHKQDTSSGV